MPDDSNLEPQAPSTGRKLTLPDASQKNGMVARSRAKKESAEVVWTREMTELAQATLLRNLFATKRFFDKPSGEYVDVPDATAQNAAAVAICNHAIGLPVQKVIRMDIATTDRHEELVAVARTPSGRAMLLAAGLITHEWLAKHLPDESQQLAISQPRDKSQVVDVEE